METNISFKKRLDTIFWALLLIWWGLRWSVLAFLPDGSGLIGTGILLLSANPILKSRGLPANPNNTFFGLITLISGGAMAVISFTHLTTEVPVFEIILIAVGVVLLGFAFLGKSKQATSQT